ncbi:MAG: GSU2403 family nucleotidyltransferase fold protein [Steroidobacterales bacterium]
MREPGTPSVRAVPYATEDVYVARRSALAVPAPPSLFEILRMTGIDFFEVPPLRRRQPSTSFAERGRSRLRVDLLAPSRGVDYPTVPVPELHAHAKGLPYLAYLLGASQTIAALSSYGVVSVRVPVPERFAAHKLITSQLRGKASGQAGKDLNQAATLIEALAERFPGAVDDALRAIPKSARRYLIRAVQALKLHLPSDAEVAWESLARARQ